MLLSSRRPSWSTEHALTLCGGPTNVTEGDRARMLVNHINAPLPGDDTAELSIASYEAQPELYGTY